jgi:hypothetical protein
MPVPIGFKFVHDAKDQIVMPIGPHGLDHFINIPFLDLDKLAVVAIAKGGMIISHFSIKGVKRRKARLPEPARVKELVLDENPIIIGISNPLLQIVEVRLIKPIEIIAIVAGFDIGFFFLIAAKRPKAKDPHAVDPGLSQRVDPLENLVIQIMIESELLHNQEPWIPAEILELQGTPVSK